MIADGIRSAEYIDIGNCPKISVGLSKDAICKGPGTEVMAAKVAYKNSARLKVVQNQVTLTP